MTAAAEDRKYQPLTEALVREAVAADRGEQAHLLSWEIRDFTKKGDNYACFVTSVNVKYQNNQQSHEKSYVVKMSHQLNHSEGSFQDMIRDIFVKEGTCLTEIIPSLNKLLRNIGFTDLQTAKAYSTSYETGKETLVMEDLRARGFKMFDRRRGMDALHAVLVLKELGKLHAASLLLEKKLTCELPQKWTCLQDKWLIDDDNAASKMFTTMIEGQIDAAMALVEKVNGLVLWEVHPATQVHRESLSACLHI